MRGPGNWLGYKLFCHPVITLILCPSSHVSRDHHHTWHVPRVPPTWWPEPPLSSLSAELELDSFLQCGWWCFTPLQVSAQWPQCCDVFRFWPRALLGPAVSPAGVGVRVGGVVVAAAGVHLLKHGPVLIFILINLFSKLQKLAQVSRENYYSFNIFVSTGSNKLSVLTMCKIWPILLQS